MGYDAHASAPEDSTFLVRLAVTLNVTILQAEKILASAPAPDDAAAWTAVAERLLATAPDLGLTAKLIERLLTLNKRYRRVAAHDAAVEREAWILGRGLILGPDQIVPEITRALPSSDVDADEDATCRVLTTCALRHERVQEAVVLRGRVPGDPAENADRAHRAIQSHTRCR